MRNIIIDCLCRALALSAMLIGPWSMPTLAYGGERQIGAPGIDSDNSLEMTFESEWGIADFALNFQSRDRVEMTSAEGTTVYTNEDFAAYTVETVAADHHSAVLEIYEYDTLTGTVEVTELDGDSVHMSFYDEHDELIGSGAMHSSVPFRSLLNSGQRGANGILCVITAIAAVVTAVTAVYNTFGGGTCTLNAFLECIGANNYSSNYPCTGGAASCCATERSNLESQCRAAGGQPGNWTCSCT